MTQGANTLFNQAFDSRPVQWRQLVMTNTAGINGLSAGTSRETLGNFGNVVGHPWIYQHSNGFQYATSTTPHVDFIGPAVVVDQPGSASFGDYEMKVRIGAIDDDGLGVLVRVKDDNNFYRINFSRQSITDATNSRAPQGLSIQKVQNGVWSEIFQDDQNAPLFVYQNGTGTPDTPMPMFDLRVQMIGNTFGIQVIDNNGTVINYPLISDNSGTPILAGSVGFTTWGTTDVFYLGYGGTSGPLLIEIPEPATVCLAFLAALGFCSFKRSR